MKKIIVGSHNPVKLAATQAAFSAMWPNEVFSFITFDAPSLVSDQPHGDDETKLGAYNRALGCKAAHLEADFFVGLEGGNEDRGNELWAMAWMCVIDKDNKVGYGKSGSFKLPQSLVDLIKDGVELGHAADQVFNLKNSKQGTSTVGYLTDDAVTRASFYTEALIFALIPFKKPDLYI